MGKMDRGRMMDDRPPSSSHQGTHYREWDEHPMTLCLHRSSPSWMGKDQTALKLNGGKKREEVFFFISLRKWEKDGSSKSFSRCEFPLRSRPLCLSLPHTACLCSLCFVDRKTLENLQELNVILNRSRLPQCVECWGCGGGSLGNVAG